MIVSNSGPHIVQRLEDELEIARERIKELEAAFGTPDEILAYRMIGLSGQQARIAHLCYTRALVTPDQCRLAMYADDPERRYDVQEKGLDVVICQMRKKLKAWGVEVTSHGGGSAGIFGYLMRGPAKSRLARVLASKANIITGGTTDMRTRANRAQRSANYYPGRPARKERDHNGVQSS